MKKHFSPVIISGIALLMFCNACKKSDSNITASNTFHIGPDSYSATKITSTYNSVMASDGSTAASSVVFIFATLPTSSGIYKVSGGTNTIGTNEVQVIATKGTLNGATNYLSSAHDTTSAQVIVSGGKVTVSLPATWVISTSSGSDSVLVSADVTEQ